MNDNAKKWVKALRSGNYSQVRYCLQRPGLGFCCMGVACELAIQSGLSLRQAIVKRTEIDGVPSTIDCVSYDGQHQVLPHIVMQWLGLRTIEGAFKDDTLTLTALNDSGRSFVEIADIIERYADTLFTEDSP